MSAALAAADAAGGGCALTDPLCIAKQAAGQIVSSAASDALQQFVNDILKAYGKAIASLGSIWVDVPSPVTTGDGGGGTITAPPQAAVFTTLLGWVVWVAAGTAVVSLIVAGAMMAARRRHGDGEAHLGRVGVILGSVVLISAASALVAGFLPATLAGNQAGSIAGWVQDRLAWYTAGLAVLSILVAAARMAWTQRAMPLRDLAGSVLTLIAVAGAGLVAIRLATQAADAFSVWVLNGSTDCEVGSGDCFGRNITALIALTAASPIGTIGLFLLGLLAVLMTYVQVALMVLRSAMLVLLAGVLPVSASFTNTQVGRQWFTKALGWTVAFVLYKPAAAIVYATAFRLTGSNAFRADGTGLFQILAGLALMLIALIALPALMRFLVPAVAAIGGSAGGGGLLLAGAGAAGVGELATGAIRSNRTGSGSGGGGGASGPTGSAQAAGRGAGAAAAGGSAAGGGGGAAAGAAAAAGPVGLGIATAGIAVSGLTKAAGAAGTAVLDATGDVSGSKGAA
ncbi:hypothetical protein [Amnibacterium endophyticum]|uniref:Integral membrane protein n=1 Tax=Amnibacterium endophyticum TaxID=2109337 RepID=A0ABW4LJQ7_9MICO